MAPPKATSHGDGAGAAGGGGALTERSAANPTLVDRPKASITAEASVFTNLPHHSRDSPAKNRRRRPRPPGPNADNSQCLVLRSRPSRFGKQIAEAIDYFLGKSPKSETKKTTCCFFAALARESSYRRCFRISHVRIAHLAKAPAGFINHQCEERLGRSGAVGGQSVHHSAPDEHKIGSSRECFDDVFAGANAAIEYKDEVGADGRPDVRKHIEGGRR